MLELKGARTLCEGMSRTKQAKGNRSGHLSEMQPKGTLCKEMRREKYFKTSVNWDNRRCHEYKEKTQQDVINLEAIVGSYCLVTNIVRTCKS
jgi:hypothetical protein